MSDLLHDIWHDLQAKRLWPVAAVLAVAIVAIPAVLTKSAAEPPVPEPAAASQSAPDTRAALALDDATPANASTGSSLDVFTPDDPFRPPSGIKADGAASTGPVDVAAAGVEAPGGGAPPGGDGSEGDDGDAGGQPTPPPTFQPPKTTEYEYVADVSFWNGQRRRRIEGLRKLDMLPDEASPALIFLGATSDGGNAVFLVDASLKTSGEGSCRPSRSNCAFVHVGPGAEHIFSTPEGDTYRVLVEEIRRVKVRAGSAVAGRPTARSADGASPRRFALPSLIDLVRETTVAGNRSSISEDGR
jgi:hypothetical protein